MINRLKILFLLLMSANTATLIAGETVNLDELSMKNAKQPFEGIVTGGQPSLIDLKKLKKQGIKNIINLRGAGEFDGYDEVKETKVLGFNYITLEISSASDINIENSKKFDNLLNNLEGKTLVHCASSNRVGALFALREALIKGKSVEDAILVGKSAGLYSLEKRVKAVLNSVNKASQ